MSRNATSDYPAAIERPKVLLAVAHPRVGEGLDVLLRLERRYDTRRATRLPDAIATARAWPADVVIVAAALLPPEGVVAFDAPALVLAGSEEDASAYLRRVERPIGWVRSDATREELVAALDRALPRPTEAAAGPLALCAIAALAVVLLGLLLYLAWIAIV